MPKRIALLHPGDMGVTVGACAMAAGHRIGWSADGRSAGTRARAERAGFETFPTLRDLVDSSDMVVSVCPPAAATVLAREVAACGFSDYYVDANAISPHTARAVAEIVGAAGAGYVDGGIIGPPARAPNSTRLYLSGVGAAETAACFAGSNLEAIDIGTGVTSASALKMCYAAWTKGSAALLLAVAALARAENVAEPLRAEWHRSLPGLETQLSATAAGNAPKAWRFADEMIEIAETFAANGLSGDFHRAAAETYALLSEYKGTTGAPQLDDVLHTLLQGKTAPLITEK